MNSEFPARARDNQALARQWAVRTRQPVPFILQEIERRMISRAQIMRPVEGGVLHHGWLHPDTLPGLQALFVNRDLTVIAPAKDIHNLKPEDISPVRTLLNRFMQKKSDPQVGQEVWLEGEVFPVPGQSMGMVWSPLWLHAHAQPLQCLGHWASVLKPEGGLFFTLLGPDSLQELAPFAALLGVELPDFPDMHDWGDLLGRSGFSDPVMEMERITLTYQTPHSLLADCRALFGNFLKDRPKGLLGKNKYKAALARLEDLRSGPDSRLNLTLEVLYGHAWKVIKNSSSGETVIPLSAIGGRKSMK